MNWNLITVFLGNLWALVQDVFFLLTIFSYFLAVNQKKKKKIISFSPASFYLNTENLRYQVRNKKNLKG